MRKTQFAGLTVLEPGEGLDTDNGAFIDRDRDTIDHFLRLGAKLHRHNGAAGLNVPTQAPSGAIIASAGTIPGGLTVSLGYTLEDAAGGETTISPLAVVSTGSPLEIPGAAPSAAIDYGAGSLLVDTYYYITTWTDGEGGETPAGPAVSVERAPGFASGQVLLSNLDYGMSGAGASSWRLYRAKGGGSYDYLASGGIGTKTFTDDGSKSVDCDIHPPTDSQNSTRQVNSLLVTLPASDPDIAKASFINLYGSISGDFSEGSSLAQYPVASAGNSVVFPKLEFGDLMPPDVNLSVGGASPIDPDTELLDWHWLRPVAASALLGSGSTADVRLVMDGLTGPAPFVLTGSGWRELQHHISPREVVAGLEHRLQVTDDGNALEVNASANTKVQVPSDAVVGLPTGAVVQLVRIGTGSVGVAASAGVTLRSRAGASAISAQYGVAHLRKRAPNDWLLYGDLA